jgi:hypothetical protein
LEKVFMQASRQVPENFTPSLFDGVIADLVPRPAERINTS